MIDLVALSIVRFMVIHFYLLNIVMLFATKHRNAVVPQ